MPKSEIYGGEIELTWTPFAGLTISQNFGYKEGEYSEYFVIDAAATNAVNPVNGPWDIIISNNRSGEPLQFPKFNYSGSIAYDWSMAGVALRAETNYNQRDGIYNASSASVLPGYWLWNANLSAGPPSAACTTPATSRPAASSAPPCSPD